MDFTAPGAAAAAVFHHLLQALQVAFDLAAHGLGRFASARGLGLDGKGHARTVRAKLLHLDPAGVDRPFDIAPFDALVRRLFDDFRMPVARMLAYFRGPADMGSSTCSADSTSSMKRG
jgi:hypothetical protein